MTFGFVILSHKDPGQTRRLVRTINALYGDPPIAMHHDHSQSRLEERQFPNNVHFIDPVVTPWGKWPIIDAVLDAVALLYEKADPDYFFLISATDYPTASPAKVEADLRQSGADAFLDHFDVASAIRDGVPVGDPHLAHHRSPDNLRLEQDHYLRAQIKIPIIRFRPPAFSSSTGRYPRPGRITVPLPFGSPFSPFKSGYRCYCGSLWFTGSRKVAIRLQNPSQDDLKLRTYYKKRIIVDESYFQTIICNASELIVDGRTHRWAAWHGAHPVDLGVANFDEMIGQGAHFSRKFRPDDPVLDLIDRKLGIAGA